MRASGAEVRRARRTRDGNRFRICRDLCGVLGEVHDPVSRQAVRDVPRQHHGAKLLGPWDQPFAVFVAFAHHPAWLAPGEVIEIFLELAFDDAALFLDDQQLMLLMGEVQRTLMLQGPDHPHLVEIDAKRRRALFVDAQQAQRLNSVQMRFSGCDDAKAGGMPPFGAVDWVGAGKGQNCCFLVLQSCLDLRAGQVGPAVVQAILWR